MSNARSPRDVCSTTIGTKTEFCISINSPSLAAGAGEQAALLTQGLRQIGDRSTPQVIYDTRPQSLPRVVHAAGGAVIAFGGATDAAIVASGAVYGFDNAQHGKIFWRQGESESATRAFVGFEEAVAGEVLQ